MFTYFGNTFTTNQDFCAHFVCTLWETLLYTNTQNKMLLFNAKGTWKIKTKTLKVKTNQTKNFRTIIKTTCFVKEGAVNKQWARHYGVQKYRHLPDSGFFEWRDYQRAIVHRSALHKFPWNATVNNKFLCTNIFIRF